MARAAVESAQAAEIARQQQAIHGKRQDAATAKVMTDQALLQQQQEVAKLNQEAAALQMVSDCCCIRLFSQRY